MSLTQKDGGKPALHSMTKALFNQFPHKIAYGSKLQDLFVSENEWRELEGKKWLPGEDKPTDAVFQFYEYRIHDITGVEVTGGRFKSEQEIVVRGVPNENIAEWRAIFVRIPLRYRQFTPLNGTSYSRLVLPSRSTSSIQRREFSIEYSPWKTYTRVFAQKISDQNPIPQSYADN